MAGTRTQIKVDTSDATSYLSKVERKTLDFKPVFREARLYLEAANAVNFTAQGLPSGGWAPLQPETAAWKAERGQPPTPLIGTGELFRSVTNLNGPDNNISHGSAIFGTDIPYARFHQYGAPRAHIPERKVIFNPPGLETMLSVAGARHVKPNSAVSDLKALFR